VLYFLPRDRVLVVAVVVGVGDRKVLEANGRELLDALTSLLCKKLKKITDPFTAVNGRVICALALETNTKVPLHLFLVLRYFVRYNNIRKM
jgi:hypothetical protein